MDEKSPDSGEQFTRLLVQNQKRLLGLIISLVPGGADADDILAGFERGRADVDQPPETSHDVPSLARAEWEHIHRVLADCQGNISDAARRLGIHRRSLQRKLRKRAPE